MRFANLNPAATLKIYTVAESSLAAFRAKNKYGFTNLPHESCRVIKDEIAGTESAHKKISEAQIS